jgi:hypothetical protein
VVSKREFVLQNRQLSLAANRYSQCQNTDNHTAYMDDFDKIMRQTLLILFLSFLTTIANCQKVDSIFTNNNNAQIELGGHGLYYSLNYERVLINRQKFKTTAQIGFALYPPNSQSKDSCRFCHTFRRLPILINELISFDRHHIELGLGYLLAQNTYALSGGGSVDSGWTGFIAGRLGYRYQKPNGRLIIRAGFTPLLSTSSYFGKRFYSWGGLAIGYSFGN